MKPTIGSVVAPTDDTHWGQVLMVPTAYGVIEIVNEEGLAQSIGLRLLSVLSERLSSPVLSLADLSAIVTDQRNPSVVSLVLLVPIGMTVYVVLSGGGAAYIKRGDRLAKLLGATGSLSGQLQLGDIILLVTKGFEKAVGEDELSRAFDHLDTPAIAENLTMRLAQEPEAVGSAGLVFGVGHVVAVEEEVVAEPVYPEAPVTTPFRFHFRRAIRQRLAEKNGVLLAIVAVSTILFLGSVMLGIRKQFSVGVDTHVAGSILEAQHAYDEGVALLDLNSVKGRERLSEAKIILDALVATVSAKTKTGRQIVTLSKDVNDRLTMAMQVYRGEPQLFYDAGLLKKGALISSVALETDNVALVDTNGKTVFLLNLSSKNGQIIAGGEQFAGARLVAIHGDKVYVLVADGIHMVRTQDKKTEPLIIKKDSEWGNITSLVAFGGNIYLLDVVKSRIWKYVATDKGFSERREYLNPDSLPDFTWVTNMSIDGSVWLGTMQNKVLRFTQGQENTLLLKGITPPFGKELFVYTSDEVKHVYVLDRENKRVVMLEKDGTYLSQYAWDSGVKPTQMVVSESLKKILLVADGKIYALEMK